jgi:hypothetical protein
MVVAHHVYLSKLSTTPDNWEGANEADYDHANGWVKFICSEVEDKVVQKNKVINTAGHTKIRIVIGKFVQTVNLKGVFIKLSGDTEGSDYYNAVKFFLLRHMCIGAAASHAYPLYLHVYVAGGATAIKWMDSAEAMQAYLKVQVKGYSFTLKHDGVYRGGIQLEEA